jgi:S1-C subfamily serine protease
MEANMTILSQISDATAALVEKTARRVVAIDAGGGNPASGIVWRPGLIVTASEAIGDDERLEVTLGDGKTASATLAGRDASTDIALLRIEGASESTESFKPARNIAAGQLAVAVGRSRNGAVAASGIVKEAGGGWHSSQGGLIDRRILLDLALDRRAHGGAVVDSTGDLIGLAAFAPRHQALVIPAETVDRIAAKLAATGSVPRGYLGAGLHPLRSHEGRSGVIVMQVDENGPAKRAGIFVGDVLTAWNGEAVESVRDVFSKLGPDAVGSAVTLDIIRAGQAARVEVAIGERPHK